MSADQQKIAVEILRKALKELSTGPAATQSSGLPDQRTLPPVEDDSS
jgi:hypothetical protein